MNSKLEDWLPVLGGREGQRGMDQDRGDTGFRDLRQVVFYRMRLVILVRIRVPRGRGSVVVIAATVGGRLVRVHVLPRPAGGYMVVQRQVPGNQELLQDKAQAGARSNEQASCRSPSSGGF